MDTRLFDEFRSKVADLQELLPGIRQEFHARYIDIDPSDSDAIRHHAKLMEELNTHINVLEDDADEFLEWIRSVDSTSEPTQTHTSPPKDGIQLDSKIKYPLDIDLTWKRPVAMELFGEKYFKNTWRQLYLWACNQILDRNKDQIPTIINHESLQGRKRRYFDRSKSSMRKPYKLHHGIWAETNLSANYLRDNLLKLLEITGGNPDQCAVYLREDRRPE